MDIIKTGLGIHKTIKNVARLSEILSVFAKNGFDQIIIQSKLHSIIPGFAFPQKRIKKALGELDGADFYKTLGYRLRLSFEELGPSFVKLGQLLSTRRDLFPEEFVAELTLLQSEAKSIPFDQANEVINRNLPKSSSEIFKYIDKKAIGNASIGVVYQGELLTGEKVVLKIRRPNIKQQLINDFEILSFIAERLERASAEIRFLGLSRIIDDFFKSIKIELNFNVEATNQKKLLKNLTGHDSENLFKFPSVFDEFSSEEIIVMEYLDGIPFNKIENLEDHPDLEEKLIKSVKVFVRSLLADGFFHADLHGGNFFLLKNGQIGIIDFGLMGYLSKKNRENLVSILMALLTSNFENLVYEFLDVADYNEIPDKEALVRDIQDILTPFLGLSVQETDFAEMFQSIVGTLARHQLYLPRDWIIIFRALMTLDGVGKQVGIDFNIWEIISTELPAITKEMFSVENIMEDAMWLGRDVINSLRILPRHGKWFLKELAKRQYAFDINIKNIDKIGNRIGRNIIYLAHTFLASVFMYIGSTFMMNKDIYSIQDLPNISIIFYLLGIAVLSLNLAFFRK